MTKGTTPTNGDDNDNDDKKKWWRSTRTLKGIFREADNKRISVWDLQLIYIVSHCVLSVSVLVDMVYCCCFCCSYCFSLSLSLSHFVWVVRCHSIVSIRWFCHTLIPPIAYIRIHVYGYVCEIFMNCERCTCSCICACEGFNGKNLSIFIVLETL